jgi:hypothetical protein
MGVHMESSKCQNCHVLTSNNDICSICLTKQKCMECKRHLAAHLYKNGSPICETCRLHVRSTRQAFDGVVEEFDIESTSSDIDLAQFLHNKSEQIGDLINSAIEKHT